MRIGKRFLKLVLPLELQSEKNLDETKVLKNASKIERKTNFSPKNV